MLILSCNPFHQKLGGGSFSFGAWAKAHHIVGQTFIYYNCWQKTAVSLADLTMMQRVRLSLMRLRERLASQLAEVIPDNDQLAVVAAMTLGEKSSLSRSLRDQYSISGAAHVLALSGLHLTIVFSLLTFLFRGFRWRRYAELFALVAVWLFALLVGFSPSVVRASTMLTICTVVALFGRRAFSLNTLSFAAIVMLVANPLSLWDVGFQLSFLAVLGILLFCRPLYRVLSSCMPRTAHRQNFAGRCCRWLALWGLGMVAVSISTQLTTAPLVAYHFGRFSCYFLLTNLVVIPLVFIILCLAFAFFVFSFFRPLQLVVAKALTLSTCCLNWVLTTIASWPGSSIEGIHISVLQTLLLYVLLAALIGIVSVVKNIWLKSRVYRMQ